MKICFDLGPFFDSQSTDTENAYALRSMLDCLINVNLAYLRFARHPVRRLYQSGVVYDRTLEWDSIPALYKRGFGDCKSLTAALVAEYLIRGIEARPVFRFSPNQNGGNDFHILVYVPQCNGLDREMFEDPSKKLGMGLNENRAFRARGNVWSSIFGLLGR